MTSCCVDYVGHVLTKSTRRTYSSKMRVAMEKVGMDYGLCIKC